MQLSFEPLPNQMRAPFSAYATEESHSVNILLAVPLSLMEKYMRVWDK